MTMNRRRTIYIAGPYDTKAVELGYVRRLVMAEGVPALLMDLLARQSGVSQADIRLAEMASHLHGDVRSADGRGIPCTEDRFDAIARSWLPYVGSCGALRRFSRLLRCVQHGAAPGRDRAHRAV